jgi:hypothetical protein
MHSYITEQDGQYFDTFIGFIRIYFGLNKDSFKCQGYRV